MDDSKITLEGLPIGYFLEAFDILFEIGDQHMVAKIFQFAVCIPFQSLSNVFVLFQ
jgi:hypothetical protein